MNLLQIYGWQEIALRLLSSVLIGAVIGLNRELLGKPAGLRTNALVCLGSALIVLAGAAAAVTKDGTVETAGPSRVIQGIITGIGFLGAGVIIRDAAGSKVHGITTAATIWIAAALGILCGQGLYLVAGAGTLLTLAVLIVGRPLEKSLHRRFPGLTEKDHEPRE